MYDFFSFLGLITRVLRGFDRPPVYGMVWMIDLPAKAACSCNFWSKQSDTKLKLREVTARASGHTASVELSSVGGRYLMQCPLFVQILASRFSA